jgi:hypothetical protein
MALSRRAQLMGDLFKKDPVYGKGKKKKVGKKVAGRGKRADSRAASIVSSTDVLGKIGSPRVSTLSPLGSPRGSPNSTPNRSPRVSLGKMTLDRQLQQQQQQQHLPPSPKLLGGAAPSHAHPTHLQSPLSRGASFAAAVASPPPPPSAAAAAAGAAFGAADDAAAAAPPPVPIMRRPRAQLPPPPVDLPNQGMGDGASSRRGSGLGAGLHPDGGGAAGGGGAVNQRRSSAIASGQNAGVPARVRFEDARGGGGGVDGVSLGVGVAAGVISRGGVGGAGRGGEGGGSSAADAAAGGAEGAPAAGADDDRHFELPPLGRLPSRESRGLGVGLLPAGTDVQLPRTPNADDARLPGLFEFSTNNADHRNI